MNFPVSYNRLNFHLMHGRWKMKLELQFITFNHNYVSCVSVTKPNCCKQSKQFTRLLLGVKPTSVYLSPDFSLFVHQPISVRINCLLTLQGYCNQIFSFPRIVNYFHRICTIHRLSTILINFRVDLFLGPLFRFVKR